MADTAEWEKMWLEEWDQNDPFSIEERNRQTGRTFAGEYNLHNFNYTQRNNNDKGSFAEETDEGEDSILTKHEKMWPHSDTDPPGRGAR